MHVISGEQVEQVLTFPRVVDALRTAFAAPATIPPRSVHRLNPDEADRSAFGILPGWTNDVVGLKAFTYVPENITAGRRMIHALVVLFDRETGEPFAVVDGTTITYWRTASVSALAADYLARPDATRLLLCGTGHLAPYMVRAHAAVRPIRSVTISGRNAARAARVADDVAAALPHVDVGVTHDIQNAAGRADIITCATSSLAPILLGDWIAAGTHVDLVGNHERTGRECDSELIARARVFADSRSNVMNEAGELLIPMAEGRTTAEHLRGELADLCAARTIGRETPQQVTCFKAVGMALGDLVTARLATNLVRGGMPTD